MKPLQIKADFCQQHFNTILTFVNRCNLSDDHFGLRFLCDALPQESCFTFEWKLNEGDRVKEEELMLGIEEFWMITDERFKDERDLLTGVLSGDCSSVYRIVNVSVTPLIRAILTHFGGIHPDELPEISPSVREYAKCIHLLINLNASLFSEGTDRIHRYCAFIVYALIGLTVLLRKAWQNDGGRHLARRYTTPPHYEMPDQYVEVHILLEEPDLAGQLHFMGEKLNYALRARKYVPFTIDVSFGKDKFLKRGIHQTAMLTYYCWQTIAEVIIPKDYETAPLRLRLREKPCDSGEIL